MYKIKICNYTRHKNRGDNQTTCKVVLTSHNQTSSLPTKLYGIVYCNT